MLRISTTTGAGARVTLKVEGDLAGEWVPLLEAECRRHLDSRTPVELDFAGVAFVDRAGVVVLHDLLARGVGMVGASGLVKALLGRNE